MSFDSDMNKVIANAERQGFRHQMTEKGHHQFFAPDCGDIIVTSGTPSAPSSWDNFTADLRRAGYKDVPDDVPKKVNGGAHLTIGQYAIDLLARHSDGLWFADIAAYVCSVRPETPRNGVSGALSDLVKSGKLVRDNDKYVLAKIAKAAKPNGNGATYANGSAPTSVLSGLRILTSSGDAAIDADLMALEVALAALVTLEDVMRRNHAALLQVAALKKALEVR